MNTDKRPNILWISFEDTSPRFGCYGDRVAQENNLTPNIDRLAEEGTLFENAFCTAPVCAPSRLAIITGMYACSVGGHHMRTAHQQRQTPEMPTPYECVLPHYVKLIPEQLRAAGYYCTNNVKTDFQFNAPPTAFDENSVDAHWRNRPSADQPFFAIFNNAGGRGPSTHESGMWPEVFEKQHGQTQPKTDPSSVDVPPWLPDTPVVREAIARQYDNIAISDTWAGKLLDQLEEDGLAENTIVFFWSDHGEGLPRAKRWPYDSGLRIPLIVRWPRGIPDGPEAGTVDEQLASLIDLGPTALSAAGVTPPAHLEGQPFLGREARRREYVFGTRDRYDESYDMVRSVRSDRYLYIRHYRPDLPYLVWLPYRDRHPAMRELWRLRAEGKLEGDADFLFRSRPPEELYDVQADPDQVRNLADDPAHRGTLESMRAELDAWRAEHDRYGDVPESEMVRQWYPDGKQPQTAHVRFALHSREIYEGDSEFRPLFTEKTNDGPTLVQLHCPTQGASIEWTDEAGDNPRWRLYTEPILLQAGEHRIRARAYRVGYAASEPSQLSVVVKG